MSLYALPCAVCNAPLQNVYDDLDNQPDEGLAFQSYGHYGGTVFDPMDGSFIELNICDICLRKLAQDKKILYGRSHQQVVDENDVIVGKRRVQREYTYWNPDVEELVKDIYTVHSNSIGSTIHDESDGGGPIEWFFTNHYNDDPDPPNNV